MRSASVNRGKSYRNRTTKILDEKCHQRDMIGAF